MQGIDLYEKYNRVYDWAALARAVSFVYIKGTDGGGLANVPADRYVKAAQDHGIPVGLYHFAELTPSPEAQADVAGRKARELGATDLPLALDMEAPFKPGTAARDFTRRFAARLRANGFAHICLYASVSMLDTLVTSDYDVVWAARYGPNDGRRHENVGFSGWTIHQYTSVGEIAGVAGPVDLNFALGPFWESDDMVSDQDVERIAKRVWEIMYPQLDQPDKFLPMWMWLVGANMGAWDDATPEVVKDAVLAGLAELREQVRADVKATLGEDSAETADRIVALIGQRIGW